VVSASSRIILLTRSAQDAKEGRARVSRFGFGRFVAGENANNRAAAFTPDMYRIEFFHVEPRA
jgi:hypothetical protein